MTLNSCFKFQNTPKQDFLFKTLCTWAFKLIFSTPCPRPPPCKVGNCSQHVAQKTKLSRWKIYTSAKSATRRQTWERRQVKPHSSAARGVCRTSWRAIPPLAEASANISRQILLQTSASAPWALFHTQHRHKLQLRAGGRARIDWRSAAAADHRPRTRPRGPAYWPSREIPAWDLRRRLIKRFSRCFGEGSKHQVRVQVRRLIRKKEESAEQRHYKSRPKSKTHSSLVR